MPQNTSRSRPSPSNKGERLQRVMAEAGVASRRECERLIAEGYVEVNGEVVTELPIFVDPEQDRIIVDGRPMRRQPERKLYLMLNKPSRTLTTLADEPGSDRRTVIDLVDHPQKARLFPVGRLDYDTTGLLILTNDGDLANQLTHPSFGVPKTYRAVVKGSIEDDAVAELERGIFIADRKAGRTVGASRTAHVEVRIISREYDKTTLELTLREGRNRQVRRLLAAVGYPVKKLERIGMGPLTLKGVPRGAWRELDRHEIRAIKRAAAMVEKEARAAQRSGVPSGDQAEEATGAPPATPRSKVQRRTGPRTPKPSGASSRSARSRPDEKSKRSKAGPGTRTSKRDEKSKRDDRSKGERSGGRRSGSSQNASAPRGGSNRRSGAKPAGKPQAKSPGKRGGQRGKRP